MSFETELKGFQDDLSGLLAKMKSMEDNGQRNSTEFKTLVEEVQKVTRRVDEMDVKAAAAQTKLDNEFGHLDRAFKENDSIQRLFKDKRGSARIVLDHKAAAELEKMQRWHRDMKTTVTSAAIGFPTSGVMPEERDAFVPNARRALRMRDVLPVIPTTLGKVYWPRVNAAMTKASPVAETIAKPENQQTFTVVSEDVKTIATWIPASRQSLDDWAELRPILIDDLGFEVDKEEDVQILKGDNTGENLNGLNTQAQAFDLALMTASDGYEYVDIIAGAIQQIAEDDEIDPTFTVLHPRDWWRIRRQKDSQGRYILGDPNSPFDGTLWGTRPVITTAQTVGTFTVGAGYSQGAVIRERMGLEIQISTEHSDYFTKNMVAIRAEKRVCLCVKRANAYVYGNLVQSPA